MERINIVFTTLVTLATVVQALFAYRVYRLQKTIEDARNVCVLFCRVKVAERSKVRLSISNLADFDVWVQDIFLIVTSRTVTPSVSELSRMRIDSFARQTIGGDFHLSRGATQSDIDIFPFLNPDDVRVAEYANADFHIEVKVWARGSDASEKTPRYNLSWGVGQQVSLTRRS